ncbi:MAG: prealbumin-like fold domain-containing protein, partial [Caldilineaceae bacterium]
QTVPANSLTSFQFDSDITASFPKDLTDNITDTIFVDPGTYTVTEVSAFGWDLSDVTCVELDSVGTVGGGVRNGSSAVISVGAGDIVKCTFTNTQRGSINIKKVTNPGSAQQAFTFDPSWSANNFNLTNGQVQNSGLLQPGSYSVVETVPAGWVQTGATCSDGSTLGTITLGAAEEITCTVTNNLPAAIITIADATATNAVNDPHTFTVTVKTTDGSGPLQPAAGVAITETLSGVGNITGGTCTTGNTNALGQCTIIVNSLVAGQTEVGAKANVTVLGIDFNLQTNGANGTSQPAVKTWVDLRIQVTPATDTNAVGVNHTFNVSVTQNLGAGWVPVANGTKPVVTVLPAGFTAGPNTCAGAGTTNGLCTVTINASNAALYTANASLT